MNTAEVAKKVVELVRKQAWYEALDTLYDDDIVSVEAFSISGGSPETRGKASVRSKIDWWVSATEVHSFIANGPFCRARSIRRANTMRTSPARIRSSGENYPRSAFTQ